jgi:hypothetical protein
MAKMNWGKASAQGRQSRYGSETLSGRKRDIEEIDPLVFSRVAKAKPVEPSAPPKAGKAKGLVECPACHTQMNAKNLNKHKEKKCPQRLMVKAPAVAPRVEAPAPPGYVEYVNSNGFGQVMLQHLLPNRRIKITIEYEKKPEQNK